MGGRPGIEVGDVTVPAPAVQGQVEFLVRPWDIHLAGGEAGDDRAVLSGKVVTYDLAGPSARVRIDGPMPLELTVPRREATAANLSPGKTITVAFGRDAIHVLSGSA